MESNQVSFVGTSGAHEYLSQELAIIALELDLIRRELLEGVNKWLHSKK